MKRLVATALTALLFGQQPPPVFRSTTDLVEIDVVVRDKSGKFVPDLTAGDFELRDEGQPQPVELLTLVAARAPVSNRSPVVQPDSPAAPGTEPRSRARVFLAVFDDAHLSAENFRNAQTAATELFTKQFRTGDVGGVVVGGQVANRRLTSNATELAAAVKGATSSPKSDSRAFDFIEWPRMNEAEVFRVMAEDRSVIDGLVTRACADEPERCRPPLSPADAEHDVRSKASRLSGDLRSESERTLQILSAMLTNLERFEGRKTIVLLSEGFAADDSWSEVQRVIGLAARVNARIYTLDARGLAYRGATALDRAPVDTQQRLLDALGGGDDAINSLAADTGGFVVRNTNNFSRAVSTIAEDAGTYYVLGYRPSRALDGKFHRVSVKVKRSGVDVRARRGYVATPRSGGTTEIAVPRENAAANENAAAKESPAPKQGATPDMADGLDPVFAPISPDASAPPTTALRVRPLAGEHTAALAAGGASSDAETRGWEAYQRGDVEGARAALTPLADRAETPSWVHYALGQADYALARYRDAITQWENVRNSEPDFEPVYFDLVDGYLQLKARAKAADVLMSAQLFWPSDPDVYNALGVVHNAAGAIDEAVKAFSAAIEAAPKEPVSYLNLAIALEKRYAKSLRYFVPTRAYIGNDKDRQDAMANYRKYLEFGGPYAEIARRRLDGLTWAITKKQ
ncbi:MAG TPA: VWA domain-containing protein [Vicinamibacterales bacterium]